MWYWTTKVLTILGGIVAVAVVLVLLRLILKGRKKKRMRRPAVLELVLDGPIPETSPQGGVMSLLAKSPVTLPTILDGLERAARDPKVRGLVVRIGTPGIGLARIQELRDAILRFAESNKSTIAFAETFGEGQNGLGAYYLASACSKIVVQPSGDVNLIGFAAQTPFLKKSLEKLGVTPRLDHRKAYKNALNMFTHDDYTPEHKEATERLLSEMLRQMLEDISATRGVSIERLKELLELAPLSAEEALQNQLVDAVQYRDEVFDALTETSPKKTERRSFSSYAAKGRFAQRKGTEVAVIYGVGGVTRGRSRSSGLSGKTNMGSDSVCAAFRDAIANKKIKAILFRVDSRGGSYVASDTIWRMVQKARARGKVVVASMGDVAGSGGYFVAMAADKVIAQPGTLTGSIGVVAGKMLTHDFWERLGVQWKLIQTNDNADLFSSHKDYSEAQWARFQETLDRIYQDFVGKVADARKLSIEQAEAVAQGRVWSGADAHKHGLVDALGGRHEALAAIRDALKLKPEAPLKLRTVPAPRGKLELLFGRDRAEDPRPLQDAALSVQEQLNAMHTLLEQTGLKRADGVVQMEDAEVLSLLTG